MARPGLRQAVKWNLHSLTHRTGSRTSFPLYLLEFRAISMSTSISSSWAPDVYIAIFPLLLSKSFLWGLSPTYCPFTFCIICHLLLEDVCVGMGEWFSAQKLQKPRLQAKVLPCLRLEVGGGGVGGRISLFRRWSVASLFAASQPAPAQDGNLPPNKSVCNKAKGNFQTLGWHCLEAI